MYGIPEPGDLAGEVVAFGEAGGAGGRGRVVLGRRVGVAGHLEQVGADGVEAVVAGQAVLDLVQQRSGRQRGRRTIAAATARLRVTTGLPVIRSSSPYRARICGQSVSSAGRRPVVHRGDARPAAGTRRPRRCRSRRRATPAPSAISARSQRVRSCSASGTSSPAASVRAGRRASRSSMSASRPAHLGVVGQHPVHHAGQPDRLVGEVGAVQRPRPSLAAYPSLKIR